ncbi:MAG: phenylalanine--tRNA ligase subunit alpha [Alphaproteobacteria bacterium]|nr:phenylalanine--tRNA ligase subunit alpha [Alphaproteobacteria bacterium]
MTNLSALKQECTAAVEAANDVTALEEVRVNTLGKKGRLTEVLKTLGTLPADQRKEFGAQVNVIKEEITALLEARRAVLNAKALDAKLANEKVDITLPVRAEVKGAIHPISQTIEEISTIFADMGFSIAEGPDVESDFYNFTALNMPPWHPARQMQDSFYLADDSVGAAHRPSGCSAPAEQSEWRSEAKGEPLVLRTQTSPVQVRTMLSTKPPIRIIAPGRTFRCDYDQTHAPMFHQVEGLLIDEATHMGHLKGALMDFLRTFFRAPNLNVRFRPSYFPFTEPSAEVDIGCSRKNGELKIGEGDDWLEVLGCGMVHPNVLENCKIDSTKYQGFAFGMGVERLAMLKYGIPDLRTFFESDLRWLRHYGFAALDIPNLARGG